MNSTNGDNKQLGMGTQESESRMLLDLSRFFASRFDERRRYEWKVSFAFWAMLIGMTLRKEHLSVSPIIVWVAVFLYAILWLRGVWIGNKNDKNMCEWLWDKAIRVMNLCDYKQEQKKFHQRIEFWSLNIEFILDWAMIFHLIVTCLLALLYTFKGPVGMSCII
jgi:hypothetical protein